MVSEVSSKNDLMAEIERLEKELIEAAQLNVGISNLLAAILIENGGAMEVSKATVVSIDRNMYIEQTESRETGIFKFELRDGK